MLVDKFPDAANLALGGLVFGPVVASDQFSPLVASLGAGIWVLFMGWAAVLAGKGKS
jgi:hypothetical protein